VKKIIHNYSNLSGRTVHWDTSDSESAYQRHLDDPATRKKLEDLGWINHTIDYSYNSHGFRCEEFDRQFDVVCFGCSFTLGTGVDSKDAWPSQLASLTGLHVANLGHAGSSNDTVFRFAEHYLRHLKPRYAVWLQSDMHRLELVDDSMPLALNILATDTSNPCAKDYFVKTWFSSLTNQILNQKKNTMAFRYLCQSLDITPIILSRECLPMHGAYPNGRARDLSHPGAVTYEKVAQRVAEMMQRPNDQSA